MFDLCCSIKNLYRENNRIALNKTTENNAHEICNRLYEILLQFCQTGDKMSELVGYCFGESHL